MTSEKWGGKGCVILIKRQFIILDVTEIVSMLEIPGRKLGEVSGADSGFPRWINMNVLFEH